MHERLRQRGASFFNELAAGVCPRWRTAASGDRHSGGRRAGGVRWILGLRGLIAAANGRPVGQDRRTNFAGRWTTVGAPDAGDRAAREAAVEQQARTLLKRYGVVFRRLLTREPNAAPWRELTRIYRRLEARGEIRGGRFVSGMSGEQFALPDAVQVLREVRRTPATGRCRDDLHGRSAQPHRHRHRRRARTGSQPQSPRLSRRRAGGGARRGGVPRARAARGGRDDRAGAAARPAARRRSRLAARRPALPATRRSQTAVLVALMWPLHPVPQAARGARSGGAGAAAPAPRPGKRSLLAPSQPYRPLLAGAATTEALVRQMPGALMRRCWSDLRGSHGRKSPRRIGARAFRLRRASGRSASAPPLSATAAGKPARDRCCSWRALGARRLAAKLEIGRRDSSVATSVPVIRVASRPRRRT